MNQIRDKALTKMANTLRLLLENIVISSNTLDVGAFPSPVVPNVILHKENLKIWADKLFVSGETDEVCDECKGEKVVGKPIYRVIAGQGRYDYENCRKCKGTGHKLWHIKVEVEEDKYAHQGKCPR